MDRAVVINKLSESLLALLKFASQPVEIIAKELTNEELRQTFESVETTIFWLRPVPTPDHAKAIYRSALAKLDECRTKCPGVGGDVDAMNLRFLIRENQFSASSIKQAADRLESLSKSLDIDAASEVCALRMLVANSP